MKTEQIYREQLGLSTAQTKHKKTLKKDNEPTPLENAG